jgi:hypothetical protein
MCKALLLVFGGIPLPPDDLLKPPRHGIHQVLQVNTHEVSVSPACTDFIIASSIEIAVP